MFGVSKSFEKKNLTPNLKDIRLIVHAFLQGPVGPVGIRGDPGFEGLKVKVNVL